MQSHRYISKGVKVGSVERVLVVNQWNPIARHKDVKKAISESRLSSIAFQTLPVVLRLRTSSKQLVDERAWPMGWTRSGTVRTTWLGTTVAVRRIIVKRKSDDG
jgi:hypothetical protein